MMLEPYESLLPVLIDKAAMYGVRLFTNSAKPSFQKHNLIAITGGRLIDVANNTAIPNSTIIIENGIIKSVCSSNTVTVPARAFIIDAKGKTILPGLWDMHAHFEQPLFINNGTSDSTQIKRGKIIMKDFKDITGALCKDNITIVAGTDMGFPGYSVFRELELYVESGLTPMQAIQTATITPAKVMKMDKVTGSVEAGKRADIIIVDGDPLQNIRNIREIEIVIKDRSEEHTSELQSPMYL